MSNEMIERVARVLCSINHNDPDKKLDVERTGNYFMWHLYVNEAKAAIAAMREPTEEMISAGVVNNDVDFGVSKDCYQAMIDAALKEG